MPGTRNDMSTADLVRTIAADTGMLVRKEVELAKEEIVGAITSKARAAAMAGLAAVLALFGVGFFAAAGAWALSLVWPAWLARLAVGGVLMVLAGIFVMLARRPTASIVPLETRRTVKEDIGWARQQLKR